jgi:hypothetical protein
MLSEIDLKDWGITEEPKKLYDVKRCSICSFTDDPSIPFLFNKVDGMYSYCQMMDGSVFHPFAGSEVFVWKKN